MSSRVTAKTRKSETNGGIEGFAKRLKAAQAGAGLKVKVGLPSGSGNYPDGTEVIAVGIINEFGTVDGRIPERSFLRSTMRDKIREHRRLGRALAQAVARGDRSTAEALELLGTRAAANVTNTIINLSQPENAPSTIARKGTDNPLFDTGALAQAITHEVIRGTS